MTAVGPHTHPCARAGARAWASPVLSHPPGGPDLVWTGRLVPEKGAHLAIDAARRTGLRGHLVGPVVLDAVRGADVDAGVWWPAVRSATAPVRAGGGDQEQLTARLFGRRDLP